MKVALLNTYFAPDEVGGAEVVVRRLAGALLDLGTDVRVVTTSPGSAVVREHREGIPVVRVPLAGDWPLQPRPRVSRILGHLRDRWNRTMAARIAGVLRAEGVELLNTHNLVGISPAVWTAARAARIAVVHSLHDHKLLCPRGTAARSDGTPCVQQCTPCRLYTAGYAAPSRQLSAVAAVSRYILDRHRQAGHFDGVPAQVVGNPVPAALSPRPAPSPRLRIGYLGRLATEKGAVDLVDAVARLRRTLDVELVIAGAGPNEPVLRERAGTMPIELLGQVAAEVLLSRIDLLVVPSRCRESFGLAAAEAQAHGVPVLASARGGLCEIIDHGTTGWLYEPDDPGGLGAAIAACVANRERWDRVACAGREASARFRAPAVARRYLSLFEAAHARRHQPAEAA